MRTDVLRMRIEDDTSQHVDALEFGLPELIGYTCSFKRSLGAIVPETLVHIPRLSVITLTIPLDGCWWLVYGRLLGAISAPAAASIAFATAGSLSCVCYSASLLINYLLVALHDGLW